MSCALFRGFTHRMTVFRNRGFGTTYRSQLQVSSNPRRSFKVEAESSWTASPFNVEPIGCPETSVTKYHYTVCKIPEQRWSKDKLLIFCCVTVCLHKSSRTTDVSKGPAASIMRFHSEYEGRGFSVKWTIFCQTAGQKAATYTLVIAKGYKIIFYQLNTQLALTENNVFLEKQTDLQLFHLGVSCIVVVLTCFVKCGCV
jgi:hypothetical protein